MFGIQTITDLVYKSTVTRPMLQVGSYVWVKTMCYDDQLGRVEAIVPSPFYGENWLTAYVVGNGWTEYIRVEGE